jgi:hypothetical protein
MSLSVIASPEAEADLVVILSLLEAHGIPYFVHNSGLSGLFPILEIYAFNNRRVMVPTSCVAEAMDAISVLTIAPVQESAPRSHRIADVLRLFVELYFTGWFVPRRRSLSGGGRT